jgi:hypothetical protein
MAIGIKTFKAIFNSIANNYAIHTAPAKGEVYFECEVNYEITNRISKMK